VPARTAQARLAAPQLRPAATARPMQRRIGLFHSGPPHGSCSPIGTFCVPPSSPGYMTSRIRIRQGVSHGRERLSGCVTVGFCGREARLASGQVRCGAGIGLGPVSHHGCSPPPAKPWPCRPDTQALTGGLAARCSSSRSRRYGRFRGDSMLAADRNRLFNLCAVGHEACDCCDAGLPRGRDKRRLALPRARGQGGG
jgi:hypothetical protein